MDNNNWDIVISTVKAKLINKLTPEISHNDIEDAVQEAVYKFLSNVPEHQRPDDNGIIFYVEKTAYYLLMDDIKKHKRIVRLELYDAFTGKIIYDILENIHFEEIDDKIDWELLFEKVLTYLSERQVKIIKLELEGYKNFEIAQKLNISEKTVNIEKKKYREIIRKKLPPPLKSN